MARQPSSLANFREGGDLIVQLPRTRPSGTQLKVVREVLVRSGIADGDEVLPLISRMAARVTELFPSPLPLLRRGVVCSISLSPEQVACILANALLCTFPEPGNVERTRDCGEINLRELYGDAGAAAKWKLGRLASYIKRVCHGNGLSGDVTYQRVSMDGLPRLEGSKVDLSTTRMLLDAKPGPNGVTGALIVVATGEIYGQPVLGSGCRAEVDELFYEYPELIASILFCGNLRGEDVIVVSGCEKSNEPARGGGKRRFPGGGAGDASIDGGGLRCLVVVNGNAHEAFHEQFQPARVLRAFRVLCAGIDRLPADDGLEIWVCAELGACLGNNGSKHLGFVLMLLACATRQRGLRLSAEDKLRFRAEMQSFITFVRRHRVTAGEVCQILGEFPVHAKDCADRKEVHPHRQLLRYIYERYMMSSIVPRLAREGLRHQRYGDPNEIDEIVTLTTTSLPGSSGENGNGR